ncbi:MAG: outer membrane beta-barrel protein [Gammaproteobacteria bacterium]|nr:outer membrane beta-barrel protein [Acidobacteriota bacterium]MYJ73665.1 outer membrane beta-barrel protein [Gammaproteobacteria bacterium]
MKKMNKPLLSLVGALSLLLVAASALAQDADAKDRWYIGIGAGVLSTSDAPAGTFSFDSGLFGSEQGEFVADYSADDDTVFELSAGVRVGDGPFGLGVTWSRSSQSASVDIVGRLPHPFFFGTPRTVEGTQGNLTRDETAIHLSFRWLVREGKKSELTVFAGPSQIELDHDLVATVRFDQTYPFDEATYAGTHREPASGDAIGYHLGIDIVRKFRNTVGVGGVVRYSQAGIDLEGPGGRSVSVDAGGLTATVDLRFRF